MAALPWWVWTMAVLILAIVVIGCWKTEALRTRKRYRVAWSRGETGDPIRDMIYFSYHKRIPEIIEDTESGDFKRL